MVLTTYTCLPVLFYGTEAYPVTSADKHSLEFTMNKVLYKIFVAMSKDSCGEICKYFGIDKVEESIRHHQEKFVKWYSGYSNLLCHSIFARLWCIIVCIIGCLFCVFYLIYVIFLDTMWWWIKLYIYRLIQQSLLLRAGRCSGRPPPVRRQIDTSVTSEWPLEEGPPTVHIYSLFQVYILYLWFSN